MNRPNGLVMYEGPSLFTGKPVALIISGFFNRSVNPKTGPILQATILPADINPSESLFTGDDASVCGSCILRPRPSVENGKRKLERPCYVNVMFHPSQVYKVYAAGGYPTYNTRHHRHFFRREELRFGAWGDPAAVPVKTLMAIRRLVGRWTGFTQAWRTCDQRLSTLLMASVHSEEERYEANRKGWRTYRILQDWESPGRQEIICPASEEGGKRTTCTHCNLCNGHHQYVRHSVPFSDPRADIAIYPHGVGRALIQIRRKAA